MFIDWRKFTTESFLSISLPLDFPSYSLPSKLTPITCTFPPLTLPYLTHSFPHYYRLVQRSTMLKFNRCPIFLAVEIREKSVKSQTLWQIQRMGGEASVPLSLLPQSLHPLFISHPHCFPCSPFRFLPTFSTWIKINIPIFRDVTSRPSWFPEISQKIKLKTSTRYLNINVSVIFESEIKWGTSIYCKTGRIFGKNSAENVQNDASCH